MIIARLALASEESDVVELARRQVAEAAPHLDFDPEIASRTFQRYLETADPTIFVVEDNREIVGYLMALIHDYAFTAGLFAAQEAIYVRPDKRETAAAESLTKIFTQWGERLGAREILYATNGPAPQDSARMIEETAGAKPVGIYLRKVL
jgi:hypothetical protein